MSAVLNKIPQPPYPKAPITEAVIHLRVAGTAAADEQQKVVRRLARDYPHAHAAVRRFPRDDIEPFELLAIDAWSEVVLNSVVPEGETPAPSAPAWTPSETANAWAKAAVSASSLLRPYATRDRVR